MARIKKELTELIGGTPLLELSRLSRKHDAKAQVVAKLEYFNPGGSVKDRIALAMIEDAETKGILKPGAVIIEPTSGNTGVVPQHGIAHNKAIAANNNLSCLISFLFFQRKDQAYRRNKQI